LILESNDPIWVKAANLYRFENVDLGATRMKLLKVWKTILEYVTEKYTERTGHEFAWGLGGFLNPVPGPANMTKTKFIIFF
jgi:hypothetical protein